jgi:hypothetical protein
MRQNIENQIKLELDDYQKGFVFELFKNITDTIKSRIGTIFSKIISDNLDDINSLVASEAKEKINDIGKLMKSFYRQVLGLE